MDKTIYDKATYLQEKIKDLEKQKKYWNEGEKIYSISLSKESPVGDYFRYIGCKYLDFNSIRTWFLQEINKEIAIARKEFNEL